MAKKTLREPEKSLGPAAPHPELIQNFAIQNELGLHARAAALFVKVASRFKSEIKVSKGSNEVNGKSIMGLLMLAAARGATVRVSATGDDAKGALKELAELIESRFGEK